ncbi:hypothetical protein B0H14DRAFT_2723434 [Mycena olivaceomarginata]|nr:hypothetical protein B0H14DRAFT_2723434 [Mycena olivaceomarginata]
MLPMLSVGITVCLSGFGLCNIYVHPHRGVRRASTHQVRFLPSYFSLSTATSNDLTCSLIPQEYPMCLLSGLFTTIQLANI